jgi:hypothetical protein
LEVVAVVEAARAAVVCAATASTQATLAEREAQKRVSRMEAKRVAALASARGEAEGFTRRIPLLEGELADMRQTRDIAKVNSRSLSSLAANAGRRREEDEMECGNEFRSLPFCKLGVSSCKTYNTCKQNLNRTGTEKDHYTHVTKLSCSHSAQHRGQHLEQHSGYIVSTQHMKIE